MAIAIRGSQGALASGTDTVTPAFGQATAAGNLLICVVTCWGGIDTQAGTSGVPALPSPWLCTETFTAHMNTQIWYIANCAASQAAPTCTDFSASSAPIYASLVEFTGVATSSPLDQHSFGAETVIGTPFVVANPAGDSAAGELIICAMGEQHSKAGTDAFTHTMNNGATAVALPTNALTSLAQHHCAAYGITTGNASIDQDSIAFTNTRVTANYASIASFKAPAVAGTDTIPYVGGGYYGYAKRYVERAKRYFAPGWAPRPSGILTRTSPLLVPA